MDITNKTRKPLSLPLPGGKRLFLGPGKTGQVSPKALEHPPIVKLIESGDIEVVGEGSRRGGEGSGSRVAAPTSRQGGPSTQRQSGDR